MDDIVATMKVIRTGAYVLIRRENQVLLEFQQNGPYVGKWDLPGLKIEAEETPEETIKQVIEEKLHGSFESSKLLHAWTATFRQPNFILHQIALIYGVEGYTGMADGWKDLSKISDEELAPLALNAKLIK